MIFCNYFPPVKERIKVNYIKKEEIEEKQSKKAKQKNEGEWANLIILLTVLDWNLPLICSLSSIQRPNKSGVFFFLSFFCLLTWPKREVSTLEPSDPLFTFSLFLFVGVGWSFPRAPACLFFFFFFPLLINILFFLPFFLVNNFTSHLPTLSPLLPSYLSTIWLSLYPSSISFMSLLPLALLLTSGLIRTSLLTH
ncbi:uncharacterized protein BDW43DRAFT_213970 [Aspergillus alliaceus]|uniref:uncharacterized protein n=1 Tax=Petromyces alliaceus TaxID=209559 RepID=UPI0012A4A487|nr:uncharacterized protein BDW43DRAFT_213970 [Aspergillus alliaceus]KAB8228568.1 hypothetical protein BDW43DRAFT_213970 [Aspergillus alliaceus]